MDVYCFSSKNLTNIWAGIGAGMWAISQRDESSMKGIRTKAQNMTLGSIGLLYASDVQALTTPFVVYSVPNPDATITDIWPEPWVMPFKIHPLGNPRKLLHKDEASRILPRFKVKGTTNISHAFAIQPTTVFVPTELSTKDWELIIERLAVE